MSARRRRRALCAVPVASSAALVAAAAAVSMPAAARPAHARAGRTAVAAASGPVVRNMVVGIGGAILSPARSLAASATSLQVGGRSCAVASATPLAVLSADRRAGGPAFALRDYGRCGSSPANSGQLFVYRVGGQTNRGQSGWEYKVDGVAGSTGAADTSGPRGDGRRLRAGDQVLWYWCAAHAGGCQRTLELSPASASVTHGGSVTVIVRGRDNEGRAAPIAGAIVSLGVDFASTDTSGRATLIAPAVPGRYAITAARRGLVPAFPGTIVVR